MLHIAICDDNVSELSNMVTLITEYRKSKHINCEYAVFSNGFDLIASFDKGKRYDVYCLDIIMPGFSGIELAKEIREYDKSTPIIFFTTSKEFALEGYAVKAINYVLKPVSKATLFSVLDELLEIIKAQKDEDAFLVKSNEGIQKILRSNLVFVEVIGRNVLYHLRSGKVIECVESFNSICNTLMKYKEFIKPHRSYLVNMQYIDTIDTRELILQTLTSIPIAQGKAREIKQEYLNYQMEEA